MEEAEGLISPLAHTASLILTIGVERLPKWVPLGHGDCQDEVLEARDAEEDGVLIVGQVLGSRHRAVQWHVPKAGRGEDRGSEGGLERTGERRVWMLCHPLLHQHTAAFRCQVA